jgi:hypothetical protein
VSIDITGYGEILETFQSPTPFQVGDMVMLSDGTAVVVIVVADRFDAESQSWMQVVTIGNL